MTEQIEAIARRLVVSHKRDGRSVYDPQAKAELVGACRQPGVSLAGVARACGINANVLSNWVRLHERGHAAGVRPRGDVIELPASSFVAVQMESAPTPQPAVLDVRVGLPNGVTLDLRGTDVQGAARLIEVLGRLRCSASTKP